MGIYTRLSQDRDGTQTATARQAADCRALAERNGWEVADLYEDTDLSGHRRGIVRPDYERMLADLRAGAIEGIVVWKLDRLTRQPGQFEAVIDACRDVEARLVSVHDPADHTTPSGLAMMRVGMAFAAAESEVLSLRLRRQRAEAADAGRPNAGGLRPFGLTRDKRGVIEAEAALVREAAARALAGEAIGAICRDWHRRGVVSSRGNPWEVTALRRMLVNPRLTGARVHHGRTIPSCEIPALLDADTHARLVALLAAPGRGKTPSWRARALSGLCACGRCGARMVVTTRRDRPRYVCPSMAGRDSCGRVVVTAEPLEALVGASIAATLDSPALTRALDGADPRAAALADELDGLRARREALVSDHYVHHLLGRPDFIAAHAAIERRIAGVEAALARRRRLDLLADLQAGETVRDAWATRPVGWRRELAYAVLSGITIDPAPLRGRHVFCPERARMHWRTQ